MCCCTVDNRIEMQLSDKLLVNERDGNHGSVANGKKRRDFWQANGSQK